ncbi:MAG: hypothetical protein QOH42_892 [Blastocatellia bacterium]|jgi:hypothetical protein|nr:hypothetical protein [Blastocatellia bacterium]
MSLRKQAEENSPGRKPGVNTPNDDVSPGGATEIDSLIKGNLSPIRCIKQRSMSSSRSRAAFEFLINSPARLGV